MTAPHHWPSLSAAEFWLLRRLAGADGPVMAGMLREQYTPQRERAIFDRALERLTAHALIEQRTAWRRSQFHGRATVACGTQLDLTELGWQLVSERRLAMRKT